MSNELLKNEKRLFEKDDNILLIFKIINEIPYFYRKSDMSFWSNQTKEEFIRSILNEGDFRKEIFKQIIKNDWLNELEK